MIFVFPGLSSHESKGLPNDVVHDTALINERKLLILMRGTVI